MVKYGKIEIIAAERDFLLKVMVNRLNLELPKNKEIFLVREEATSCGIYVSDTKGNKILYGYFYSPVNGVLTKVREREK